jgi:heat shock protein HtpX
MWEAIASNRRKSALLILLMGLVLAVLGAVIGVVLVTRAATGGDVAAGALTGLAAAFLVWIVMWLTAYAGGDGILLAAAGAREIQREDAPMLWNVVEEMTIASGLGKMPRVFLVEDPAPNAFAVGRKPETAAVAVTSGLLQRLTRDELQGVVAHEIGHVRNLDIRFMTYASVMVGSIVMISDVFLRSMFYGGGRRRTSSREGGQAQAVMMLIAVLAAILAPIFAYLLYFACSRRREYLADASAARFTRYPPGLASALEKISGLVGAGVRGQERPSRVLAPMYIINPMKAMGASGPFSTHPPTEKRIAILRGMAGGAGFADYEAAFRKVAGGACIGSRTLAADERVSVREPAAEPESKKAGKEQLREVTDLLSRLGNLLLIPCACGMRIKIPPGFEQTTIGCPRCGRTHEIPTAGAAGTGEGGPGEAAQAKPLRYKRKGGEWESFQCTCGNNVQLSPRFSGTHVRCPKCNATIEVC